MTVKKFSSVRKNYAVEYWWDFMESVNEDERISPRDMAELYKEMIGFAKLLKSSVDIRRHIK